MMTPWDLRRWLMKPPRGVKLRLSQGDAVTEMNPRGRSWSKVADSIHAISPQLIELVASDGSVIRAVRPGDEELQLSQAAPAPPSALTNDPETARLTHFANLLHRAYEHSTNVAFAKLVELVERIDDRSTAIETRLERTEGAYRRVMQEQLREAFDRAADAEEAAEEVADDTGGAGPLEQMAAAFLQGSSQARQEAPAPNNNGKGK